MHRLLFAHTGPILFSSLAQHEMARGLLAVHKMRAQTKRKRYLFYNGRQALLQRRLQQVKKRFNYSKKFFLD